jgi:hypothetical protein
MDWRITRYNLAFILKKDCNSEIDLEPELTTVGVKFAMNTCLTKSFLDSKKIPYSLSELEMTGGLGLCKVFPGGEGADEWICERKSNWYKNEQSS